MRVVYVLSNSDPSWIEDGEMSEYLYFTSEKARQRALDAMIDTQDTRRYGLTRWMWQLYPQPNGQMSEAGHQTVRVEPTAKRRPLTPVELEAWSVKRKEEIKELFGDKGERFAASGYIGMPYWKYDDED